MDSLHLKEITTICPDSFSSEDVSFQDKTSRGVYYVLKRDG